MTNHPNIATALARVVVDELVTSGVETMAICPGSRSGALAIAAAEHPDLTTCVFIDERSAGFYAVGAARASGNPAAVLSTSGTAVANFYPAVVEADMSCVPLIVLSADRPPELRGVGANQTIDQFDMFGSRVRSFVPIEAPAEAGDRNEEWRTLVRDAVRAATSKRPGPTHVNVSFREPTVPVADDGRSVGLAYPHPTPRLDGEIPDVTEPDAGAPDVKGLDSERGLVIAGDSDYDRAALREVANAAGWPLLATALSGMRGEGVVAAYHDILRGGPSPELVPETVVAVGAIGPDPLLEDLIAQADVRIRIDKWGRHIDPRRNATQVISSDPTQALRSMRRCPPAWREAWLTADAAAAEATQHRLGAREHASGGAVADALNRVDWSALVVGSSLPIREVDAHLRRPGPVFANRGASGIDGFASMALGVASVLPHTLALTGDLSFLHDGNAFLNDCEHDLTLVVIDNGGGGLFDTLPQARHAPHYERLFVTPPGRDLRQLAEFHGARVTTVAGIVDFETAVSESLDRSGLDVVIVSVDRDYDAGVRG